MSRRRAALAIMLAGYLPDRHCVDRRTAADRRRDWQEIAALWLAAAGRAAPKGRNWRLKGDRQMNKLAYTAFAVAFAALAIVPKAHAADSTDISICVDGMSQVTHVAMEIASTIEGNNDSDTSALRNEVYHRAETARQALGSLPREILELQNRDQTPRVTCEQAVQRAIAYVKTDRPTRSFEPPWTPPARRPRRRGSAKARTCSPCRRSPF